jgi:hypothetical protein
LGFDLLWGSAIDSEKDVTVVEAGTNKDGKGKPVDLFVHGKTSFPAVL